MRKPAPPERPLRIAVCGGSAASAEDCAAAEQVGRELARAGAVVVCGGLGGVMEAVARGAVAAGGLTIGLLPGERDDACNPHITIALPTGMGEGRNILVVRAADTVIAIGGEWGTLSEVALACRIGTPVVLLRPGLTAGLGLPEAGSPKEAVESALAHARRRKGRE